MDPKNQFSSRLLLSLYTKLLKEKFILIELIIVLPRESINCHFINLPIKWELPTDRLIGRFSLHRLFLSSGIAAGKMHIVRDRSRSTCWGLQAGSGRVPSRLNCAIMSVACYTTPTAASTAHKLAPRGRPTLPHEFLVRVMVITTSKESGCVVSCKIQKINNFKF